MIMVSSAAQSGPPGAGGEGRGVAGIITISKGHDAAYPWQQIGATEPGKAAGRGAAGYYLSPAERGSARNARARLMVIRTVEMVLFASPRISASCSARWWAAPGIR